MSLFIGSIIARPLGKIFASFGEDTSSDRLIGCIGTVSSALIIPQHKSKIGQVDVIDRAHNLVIISAYDTNNFFDAQGVRLRTETIQKSIQQKREVELN